MKKLSLYPLRWGFKKTRQAHEEDKSHPCNDARYGIDAVASVDAAAVAARENVEAIMREYRGSLERRDCGDCDCECDPELMLGHAMTESCGRGGGGVEWAAAAGNGNGNGNGIEETCLHGGGGIMRLRESTLVNLSDIDGRTLQLHFRNQAGGSSINTSTQSSDDTTNNRLVFTQLC